MNFSHILSIQVWSERTQMVSNYGNILNRIKDLVLEDIQTQEICVNGKKELYTLLWTKINWERCQDNLYIGDIVTEAHYMDDDIIYQHTVEMLKDIETKLCIGKKTDGDYKIIFSIVKPIVQKKQPFTPLVI
jgi:hypothetical protein